MTYCCKEIEDYIEKGEIHLHYNPICRYYSIDFKRQYGGVLAISFCPLCGSKFPSSLTETLNHLLHEEYGAECWDNPDLPVEFKSNEWWKKRNL